MRTLVSLIVVTLLVAASLFMFDANKKRRAAQETRIQNAFKIAMEHAYGEGQKDALEGDVRVRVFSNGWEYVASPWDNDENYIVKGDTPDKRLEHYMKELKSK